MAEVPGRILTMNGHFLTLCKRGRWWHVTCDHCGQLPQTHLRIDEAVRAARGHGREVHPLAAAPAPQENHPHAELP